MIKSLILKYLKSRLVTGNINRNDRSGALHRAWGHVYTSFIKGDYFEFGVYKGDSFIESYKNYLLFKDWINHQTISEEPWRREVAKEYVNHIPCFHGLDTFEDMPENDERNVTFSKGSFYADIDDVKKRCEHNGLKSPELFLYKGEFKNTQEKLYKNVGDKKAVIINIDCDLYTSTIDVLKICESFIQIGTVLLFDDYNTFSADNKKGQRKAVREFLKESNLELEPWFPYCYVGQAFLCVGNGK